MYLVRVRASVGVRLGSTRSITPKPGRCDDDLPGRLAVRVECVERSAAAAAPPVEPDEQGPRDEAAVVCWHAQLVPG